MKKQLNNKGFSLIEMLIALAVSAVVMLTVLALLTYSSNRMSETQRRVTMQDEAKDIVNHITNVAMEGSKAEWHNASGVSYVVIQNNSSDAALNRKEVVYWHIGKKIFYASTDEVSLSSLTSDDTHLLGENVKSFSGTVQKNPQSKRSFLAIKIEMENGDAQMTCSNNIYLRNQ